MQLERAFYAFIRRSYIVAFITMELEGDGNSFKEGKEEEEEDLFYFFDALFYSYSWGLEIFYVR